MCKASIPTPIFRKISPGNPMALSRRVLAIDPGSRVTGYGIIDVAGQGGRYVDSGCIRLADEAMPLRLMMIHQGVSELIRSYRPQEFAIEAIFVHKNPASALKLGQARGVAICAAVLAQLPVSEYAAKSIKQAVVGKGGAEKTQVQHMVKILLNRSGVIQSDAADALAVALTHAHHLQTQRRQQLAGLATAWEQ